MDTMTPEQRHRCMAAIKAKNTKPELIVRRYLHARGFRFRLNHKRLPGHPDLVLKKYRTCIFVNGCFWHLHEGCKYFVWPKNNADFWKNKIQGNVERDKRNYETLIAAGWKVVVVWECQLKKDRFDETMSELEHRIKSSS